MLIALILIQLQIGHRGVQLAQSLAKKAQDEQEQLAKQLKEAQRIAHVGSWQMDKKFQNVIWSDELYRIQGMEPAAPPLPYHKRLELFTLESAKRLNQLIERAIDSGEPYELELEMLGLNGEKKWLLARGEVIRDENGDILGLRGTETDITPQKNMAIELAYYERR